MPAPGSVNSGTLVSSTGPAVDDGETISRERQLIEVSNGQFELGTISTTSPYTGVPIAEYQGSGNNLPGLGYAYVGIASNNSGSQFPVFYSTQGDSYFVAGVDAVKYGGIDTYQSYSAVSSSIFTTNEVVYDTPDPSVPSVNGYYNETLTYDYANGVETKTIVSPACYVAGTRILTDLGEIAVECLRIGQLVVTASGERRPIRWIGHRSYAGRFLLRNPEVGPVRFSACCFGGGLPRHDLLVSPEHAMFIDGMLIPARFLVNGTTVRRERAIEQVDYFHIELDSHDVLLAEGAPSESFVDDDSRGVFHNAAEWHLLHPGRARSAAVFCAPRIEDGAGLEAVRRRLDLAGQAQVA